MDIRELQQICFRLDTQRGNPKRSRDDTEEALVATNPTRALTQPYSGNRGNTNR